jgi:hypothetical protein
MKIVHLLILAICFFLFSCEKDTIEVNDTSLSKNESLVKSARPHYTLGSTNYVAQIKSYASFWDDNKKAFNYIMSDVESYGYELNVENNSAENRDRFDDLVAAMLPAFYYLDAPSKARHYFRNKLNRAPITLNALITFNRNNPTRKWIMLAPEDAAFHMNGQDGEYNVKFISCNGHHEAVYNKNGVLLTEYNDAENMGTYNYRNPNADKNGHFWYDVNTYYWWGNAAGAVIDGAIGATAKAALNLIKYNNNDQAVKNYNYIKAQI